MIISVKDLEKVCNYVESTKPSLPQVVMTFMDWDESPNEEYQRELKRKNRELAIDAIVDDKVEEFKNREPFSNPLDNESYMMTITPKLNSINVQGKTYLDLFDIYNDVMMTLESLTSKPMVIPQNFNISIQKDSNLTDYENESSTSRKVITKIMMMRNLISSTSRTGPANTIIVGLEAYKYLLISNAMMSNNDGVASGNINGMNVIPTPYIKSNKIIMMRNVQKNENGLNVINCPNDMRYFLKETPNWDKIINWFEII
ncbi:MAG: hypothetical protein K9J32_07495 [Synechococcus lacustris]|nr:hypothetical protein [Synechococcus lacustris]